MSSRLIVTAVVAAAAALAMTAAWAQLPAPAAAPAAAGCTGNSQIPVDLFTQPTLWPTSSQGININVGGGKAQLQVAAGQGESIQFGGQLFTNADICVDVSVTPLVNANDPTAAAYAGIIFWKDVNDWNNFYQVYMFPAGVGVVSRVQNNQNLTLAGDQAPSIKPGAGVVNSIRVTLTGNTISAYFNGTLFKTVPVLQPSGGGLFGLAWGSETAGPNTWTFSNLKITDPPAQ